MLRNINKIGSKNNYDMNTRSLRTRKPLTNHYSLTTLLFTALCSLFTVCTFNYGETDSSESTLPDLVMENVEYVRVRSSDPVAKFQADRAERYERQRIMKLENLSFEQYGERGAEVNASGMAGNAEIQIDSGDILMSNSVRIEVASEDIILGTKQLEWKDEERTLSSGKEDIVNVFREDGTNFTGIGLSADARRRTWEFSGSVSGIYIFEDDEESAAPAEPEQAEGETFEE